MNHLKIKWINHKIKKLNKKIEKLKFKKYFVQLDIDLENMRKGKK